MRKKNIETQTSKRAVILMMSVANEENGERRTIDEDTQTCFFSATDDQL